MHQQFTMAFMSELLREEGVEEMGQKTMNYDQWLFVAPITCDLYLFVCIHAEGSNGKHVIRSGE